MKSQSKVILQGVFLKLIAPPSLRAVLLTKLQLNKQLLDTSLRVIAPPIPLTLLCTSSNAMLLTKEPEKLFLLVVLAKTIAPPDKPATFESKIETNLLLFALL